MSASSRPRWYRDVLLLDLPDVSAAATRFWIVAAVASLVVSCGIAFLPGQLHDFLELRSWMVAWLIEGRNPYTAPGLEVDYPPSSFLILAPLGLFSDPVAAALCVVINAVAIALSHWLLLRWINERLGAPLSSRIVLALAAMAICSGAARTAIWQGQTMPLGMLLGVLALRASDTRPVVSAIWLGLTAFKPHIALAFGLGILFTRGLVIPLLSLPVFVVTCLLFAPTVGEGPSELVHDFYANITRMYGAGDHTTATTFVDVLQPILGAAIAPVVHGLLAVVALGVIAIGAWRVRHDRRATVFVVAAWLLWSLMFLPHQRYGAMLAAPVWWLLLIPGAGLVQGERMRVILATGATLYSVLDLQLAVRLATRAGNALSDAPGWHSLMETIYGAMIAESGASPLRVIVAGALYLAVRALWRTAPSATASHQSR